MAIIRTDHKPEPGSLADEHGIDEVVRGLLAVKPKTEKKGISKKGKKRVSKK